MAGNTASMTPPSDVAVYLPAAHACSMNGNVGALLSGRTRIIKHLRRFRAAAAERCTFSGKMFEDRGVYGGATWRFSNNFADFAHTPGLAARFRRSCLEIAGSARASKPEPWDTARYLGRHPWVGILDADPRTYRRQPGRRRSETVEEKPSASALEYISICGHYVCRQSKNHPLTCNNVQTATFEGYYSRQSDPLSGS